MSLSPEIRTRLSELTQSEKVFLFMKGNPAAPQCGFSAQVISILDRLIPTYATFDVLSDPDVRNGIKDFSDWPTIPQLYIGGEFMGGCDIIKEMYENGELHQALGIERAGSTPPDIQLSDAAAEFLKQALGQAGQAALQLSIDAHFKSSLGIGPAQPGQIEVVSKGIAINIDPDSAVRANGVSIDTVDTPEGTRLAIDNPNAPRVGQLDVATLKQWIDAGEKFEFFDVRTEQERASAQIASSRLLDAEARAYLEALPRDTPIVFHCHHGGRSQAAAEHYAQLGFTNTHNLEGGIDAWSTEIDPSVPRY